ncbi:MAG TPA: 50S ribosomal protein L9 [Ktedonobacterales bacterium]|nr:50S ribosomal protein L9 [Ktedonobacterales bacterium]
MKVILLHEVPGLGKPGDVKDVAAGYARNYLLPRQLVTVATAGALANLQQRVAAAQARAAKQRSSNESLAEKLSNAVLTFAVRVGRGDRLYGSVTSQDIAGALLELEHLSIDRRLIQLKEPLRALGEFEVPVRIASGIEPKVKVRIISREAAEAGAGAPAATAITSTTAEPVAVEEEPAETAAEEATVEE